MVVQDCAESGKKRSEAILNNPHLLKMIAKEHESVLKAHLNQAQYLLLVLLIGVLQTVKAVKLELLANALPLPILFESRRKKIQRFLDWEAFSIENCWFPWLKQLVAQYWSANDLLYIAIDRTSWGWANILMVSLIWNHRAWPIYWIIFDKKGSSNLKEQQAVLVKVIGLLEDYRLVVLGDREFCSVKLGKWLSDQDTYFCLRQKQDTYLQQDAVWLEMRELGLKPGMSLFLNEVNITKQLGFGTFNVACKWKRKYRGFCPNEGWYILTNLGSLDEAIRSYQKRFCIEEMFRDFKAGGYKLEGTKVEGVRLQRIVLLIAIAYTTASLGGKAIQKMGIQKYIGRVEIPKQQKRRHSSFYIGLHAHNWVRQWQNQWEIVEELIRINRHKLPYYRKGLRAMELTLSTI